MSLRDLIKVTNNFCHVKLKAVPNARKTEVVGWLGDQLKIKVQAPPVDGKANEEIESFFCELLGLSKSKCSIIRGQTSTQKTLQLECALSVLESRLPSPKSS